jgi:hypothetical protein
MATPTEDRSVEGDRAAFSVPIRGIAASLIGAVVLVNLANVVAVALRPWEEGTLSGTADWMLLTSENNLPTWLSASIWLAAATTALVMSRIAERGVRARWVELSAVLLMFSIDEAASVHEKLSEWLDIDDGDLVAYAWVIPALVIVIVISVRLTPFILRLDRVTRRTIVGGFGLLLLGALVVETVAGEWDEARGADNVGYHLISAVEENLEFAGGIVMFIGLLAAIRRRSTRLEVTLD